MKRCSRCNQTYDDDNLNFCLADGAPLVHSDSEATVVIPRPAQPAQKSKGRLVLWLGLAVLTIGVEAIVLAAALIYRYSGIDNNTAAGNQSTPDRQTALSSPKPKPSPSPTPTTNDSSDDPTATPDSDGTSDDIDEVTPILWDTTASGFKGIPGKTYTFQCPADGTERSIWGNDIYTDYSSICTAAVHVGAITLKEGGVVTIEYRPGRSIYGSTVRNEIKSNTVGEHTRSFVIRTNSKN